MRRTTAALVATVAAAALAGCSRQEPATPAVAAWAQPFRAQELKSETCAQCHPAEAAAWRGSDHAAANRLVDPARDAAAFHGQTATTHAARYTFELDDKGQPAVRERRAGAASPLEHHPTMVLAHRPLRQVLIETQPGRYQASEFAWDPARAEWFAVFGSEERNPGEWGHWTGRGMNWNSMCARCHMTAFEKNYDPATDTYASRWSEQAIGCIQCHGALPGHEKKPDVTGSSLAADRSRMMETCASCHSRAESLTAAFPPGAKYDDHFRLQPPVEPGLYHPDGQIRDEVFVFGSFRHSKMHAAGVTCMDCHEPHSGALVLPQENNALCMQCHQAPGKLNAPVIEPTAHSHHAAGSAGNRCVECHMVETTYMQRDPRRDHGFIIPDPVLSRELGVPNACNRCHADRSLDWAIDNHAAWYGESAERSRQRRRARAIAGAWEGQPDVVDRLLALVAAEKVPAWRASLLSLAGQTAPEEPTVFTAARELHAEADPLVRAAAVRVLAADPTAGAIVDGALQDPVRAVRLDAAWARSSVLSEDSPNRRELDAYLDLARDQPGGQYRLAQDLFNRGRRAEAATAARLAMEWDPLSPAFPEALGLILSADGKPREAAQALEKAAGLAPNDASVALSAALAWSEAGDLGRAESMLGEALRRDRTMARAWYNYGLLQAQTNRREQALVSLAEAGRLAPRDPDPPYALATVLLQLGRRDEALAAAQRALAIAPDHPAAADLVRSLGGAPPR